MEQNKLIGIVAYITIIGLVIALILNQEKKDPFAGFHIRQSLGIFVSGIALSLVALVPLIGWILAVVGSLLILVLWVMGLMNAIGGNMTPVPLLGERFEEWFSSVA